MKILESYMPVFCFVVFFMFGTTMSYAHIADTFHHQDITHLISENDNSIGQVPDASSTTLSSLSNSRPSGTRKHLVINFKDLHKSLSAKMPKVSRAVVMESDWLFCGRCGCFFIVEHNIICTFGVGGPFCYTHFMNICSPIGWGEEEETE